MDIWKTEDKEGKVYGTPFIVEVDVAEKDGEKILFEIKSSVNIADVGAFHKIADIYEASEGSVSRRVLISPHVAPSTLDMTRRLGIEVFKSQEL